MISIQNLSYHLTSKTLYDESNLFIGEKDKIGLIGPNGCGKSTLLKILDQDITNYSGVVSMGKNLTIGFLNQDLLSYQSDESILFVVMQAYKDVLDLEHQMEKVIRQMETNYEDSLVDKLTALQEKFEIADGYQIENRAASILENIGFSTEDLKKPLKNFSGGWRMRVMLAKLLLEKPSLLMLDEPTNHLDLPSIKWIEEYLQTYDGAFILVSHDRTFLNNTIKKTVEVSQGKLIVYEGNYDFYETEKALQSEIQKNAFENQQQKIKEAERFIERFKAKATKAKQAQSRVKMLDRMERVENVIDDTVKVNFNFKFKVKSGRHVANLNNISKSFGDLKIFENANINIEKGDKIGLIGANGKGKSTLLRIVAQTEKFDGKVEMGHNVIPSFFAQHQLEALDIENEIIQEMSSFESNKTVQEIRTILGCFLFSGDDIYKKIKVLSGGEKSRVALAKTLVSEANFLILDEPTNHLDMLSVKILIQALQQYEGTLLFVSHDRHFISHVANKIWWIEDHKVKEYIGTYDEYEWWASKNKIDNSKNEAKTEKVEKPKTPTPTNNQSNPKDKDKQEEKKMKNLENTIAETEKQIKIIEDEMANPNIYANHEKFLEINENYTKLKEKLELLNKEWEQIFEQLNS